MRHHLKINSPVGWPTIALFPGEKFLASWIDERNGPTGPTDSGPIRVLSARSGRVIRHYKYHRGLDAPALAQIAFSPDGRKFVTVASFGGEGGLPPSEGSTTLRSSRSGRVLNRFGTQEWSPLTIHFSPDSKLIAGFGPSFESNDIKVWDVRTGRLKHTFSCHPYKVAFSPDSKTLAAIISQGAGTTVTLWNVETGQLKHTFQYDLDFTSLAFSPDGKSLAISCWDKTACWAEQRWDTTTDIGIIRLWDLNTGTLKAAFSCPAYDFLVYSPDGRLLACANRGHQNGSDEANSGRVVIWRVR